MGLVDIGRMRRALVQETRGRYIGDVDPDVFVEEFMGWNNGTSKSFRLKQPSETRVSCLVGMASKHESGMNKDWQIALSGWPPVRKQDKIQSLDFEDTHDCRDAETHLGPDSCIYFRARPIVPRHTRRKVDFANVQSFTEHKASDKMDAFVDGGDEDYDGGTYYVMAGYSKRKGGAEEGEKEDEDEKEGEGEEEREAGTREEPYIADSPAAADVDADGGEAHPEVVEDREPTPSENYPFENNTKQGQSTRGQIASYAGVTMAMQLRSHLFSVLVCGRYARFIRWDRSCAIVTRRFDYTMHPLIIFDFYKRFAQLDDVQRGLHPNIRKLSKPAGMKAVEMMRKYATSYFTGQHADFYKKESNPNQLPLLSLVLGEDTYVVPAPYFDGAMYSPFGRCTRNRAVILLKERRNAEEAKDGTYGKHGQILYLKEYWREESIYTKKESEVYRILEGAKVTFIAKMHAGGDLMTGEEANAKAITTIGHEWKSKPWGTWQFMSGILTQYPENASHTVVDDRESALHVLTYMALRHLRHDSKTQSHLKGLLAAFDLYVSEDGQADVGTEYKAGSIVKGGPEVKFDIRAITFLIRELSGFFAPRYIKTYDMTAAELELMSEEDLAEYEKEKEQHRQKLAKLLDPTSDFVCKTMRRWAAKMPEPPDNVTQWVDNMKGQGGLLKRSGNHMASAREKMSLRCDGRVSFKSADTRPSTPLD
ncbi:hypothetical protein EYR40_004705 [Pleurotus pulmonarius]|nr:hypothetical protein EYR40_004705 [Pleurotus pulmonarius]